MASTRNNNAPGNYCIQQRGYNLALKYDLYKNSQYGTAYTPAIPCIGYTPSHMPRNTLSNNPVEIESALFGINSTNLVNGSTKVVPQLNNLPFVSFFDRPNILMPNPLIIEKEQRIFPLP